MSPLENRNDDLAFGLAHRGRSGGCPEAKRTSCVGWGRRLPAAKHSKVLDRNRASALRLAREGLSNLFCHQARWQSGPARQNRAREAHNNMFGQTILISQILVSRKAVEKSEVSELDADLVVADAPQAVVDRLGPRSSSHRVEPCSASHLEPPRFASPRSHSLGACS